MVFLNSAARAGSTEIVGAIPEGLLALSWWVGDETWMYRLLVLPRQELWKYTPPFGSKPAVGKLQRLNPPDDDDPVG